MNNQKSDKKLQAFKLCLSISVMIHVFLLAVPLSKISFYEKPQHKFKVSSIQTLKPLRSVGIKNGIEDYVHVEKKKTNTKATSKNKGPKKLADLRSLGLSQGFFAPKQIVRRVVKNTSKKPAIKKSIRPISLNKNSISSLLRNTPNAENFAEYQRALENTESMVNIEVPKGVLESELNEHELVYYGFQKRTALNYVNSFYKKLNEFQLQNPHLNFPMTHDKKKMTGRVTYDAKGNIVRIKMTKWTNIKHLQDFFEGVLREMHNLPNPPDSIVKDGEFTVFFSLNVNGR